MPGYLSQRTHNVHMEALIGVPANATNRINGSTLKPCLSKPKPDKPPKIKPQKIDKPRIVVSKVYVLTSNPELVAVPDEEEIAALRALPYREYLGCSHWQRLRQVKMKEAEYRCQLCYSSRQLQVHHRTYERLGCEYLTDLIALCDNCHVRFHKILPKRGE